MQNTINVFPINSTNHYFGPAITLEAENRTGEIKIQWNQENQTFSGIAKISVERDLALEAKRTVLVAGSDFSNMYVIGLLDATPNSKTVSQTKITSQQGAYACIDEKPNSDILSVYDENSSLLFRYDSSRKQAVVNVDQGDIILNSPNGNINLNAGKTVEVNGDALALNAKKLSIKAIVSEMILGRLETTTDTLIEHAKNTYRNVKELSQLRAGRTRTLVDETYQLNADKVLLKSENDVKVKAEKIHLG